MQMSEDAKVPATQGTTQAHTAGEWEANRYDEIWAVEVLDGGAAALKVFVASAHDVEDAARSRANARLIAAAPDLLEALLPIVTADGGGSFRNLTGMNAQLALAAISKATGR
jgi:hypothetical protein